MDSICIFEATRPLTEYLEAANRLLPQLSRTAQPLTMDLLSDIVSSGHIHLFFLRVNGLLAGMCTLAVYASPTGCKAWIDDLVVDSGQRGRHLGRQLLDHAVNAARQASPCTLMLTSRPSRTAANRLYRTAGFENKKTNVYRMEL